MNAQPFFKAFEVAGARTAIVIDSMYRKTTTGTDYLVRTSAGNAKKNRNLDALEPTPQGPLQ